MKASGLVAVAPAGTLFMVWQSAARLSGTTQGWQPRGKRGVMCSITFYVEASGPEGLIPGEPVHPVPRIVCQSAL